MKAMTENNRSSRVLATVMILTMAAAVGYGQGLLAEGAAKLFNALTSKNNSEQTMFHQVAYAGKASAKTEREFSPEVIRSFSVEAVEITFEEEVKSEDWMTESFAENVEAGVPVETWMTSPISESLEMPVSVEDWMTTPLYTAVETAPEVESWMTTPLITKASGEEKIQLEDWMTEALR